jgi:vancomycin permeability regulator SanA
MHVLIKIFMVLIMLLCMPFWVFSFMALDEINQTSNIAVVLGAGVTVDKQPSHILKERLNTALRAYENDQVEIIVVSGDNRDIYYDEPKVMKNYLTFVGVEDTIIVSDFAGRSTADTCWRMKNVFKAKEITLVSQPFHLPRAYSLCQSMGLKTHILPAPNTRKQQTLGSLIREIPASWVAVYHIANGFESEVKADGNEVDLSGM